jgi:hypothetical protein
MQLADKVKKLAGKTHKDRVHEFNSKLETLSEHHDIPKVSIVYHLRLVNLINASIRLALDKVIVPPHNNFLAQHNGRVDCVGKSSRGIECCSVFVRRVA